MNNFNVSMPAKVCNFCATSALGISWQHLNHPNLFVPSVYWFHMYFHVRIIPGHLGILMPHDDGFCKVKTSYVTSACYSDDYAY